MIYILRNANAILKPSCGESAPSLCITSLNDISERRKEVDRTKKYLRNLGSVPRTRIPEINEELGSKVNVAAGFGDQNSLAPASEPPSIDIPEMNTPPLLEHLKEPVIVPIVVPTKDDILSEQYIEALRHLEEGKGWHKSVFNIFPPAA